MATFTLKRADVFPEETEVSLYAASDWPFGNPSGEPAGDPVGDPVEVTNGEAEFTADAGSYYAYAEVGGRHRYISVSVGQDSEPDEGGGGGGGGPVAAEDVSVAGIDGIENQQAFDDVFASSFSTFVGELSGLSAAVNDLESRVTALENP